MAFPIASGLQFTHWDFLLPSMNNFNIAQWVVMNSSDLSENQLSPKNDILRKRNDNNVDDISVFIFVNKLPTFWQKFATNHKKMEIDLEEKR